VTQRLHYLPTGCRGTGSDELVVTVLQPPPDRRRQRSRQPRRADQVGEDVRFDLLPGGAVGRHASKVLAERRRGQEIVGFWGGTTTPRGPCEQHPRPAVNRFTPCR